MTDKKSVSCVLVFVCLRAKWEFGTCALFAGTETPTHVQLYKDFRIRRAARVLSLLNVDFCRDDGHRCLFRFWSLGNALTDAPQRWIRTHRPGTSKYVADAFHVSVFLGFINRFIE